MCTDFNDARKKKGFAAEQAVADYLSNQGYRIIARNYRLRGGELDLIAQQESVIAVVEVKMREHEYFDLSQVITHAKQRKIIRTAQEFLLRHNYNDDAYVLRFDVALVLADKEQHTITYIADAFTQEW